MVWFQLGKVSPRVGMSPIAYSLGSAYNPLIRSGWDAMYHKSGLKCGQYTGENGLVSARVG